MTTAFVPTKPTVMGFPLRPLAKLLDRLDHYGQTNRQATPGRDLLLISTCEVVIVAIPGLVALAAGVSILATYVMSLSVVIFGLFGITLLAHRQETHHSIKLHPIVDYWLRGSILVSSGMKIHEWVAVHTVHHLRSDTEDDPHSPVILGVWHVYVLTAKYFRDAKHYHPEVIELIEQAKPKLGWMDRKVFQGRYVDFGPTVALPLIQLAIGYQMMGFHSSLLIVLFTWPFSILWFLHAGGTINAWGHTAQQLQEDSGDYSTDLSSGLKFILNLVTLGEGTHHYHHLYPDSALFGKYWWKDIGYMAACALQRVRLAKVFRVIPI